MRALVLGLLSAWLVTAPAARAGEDETVPAWG